MYEFAPRLAAAATRHLRGLVIVPVLAIMVVLLRALRIAPVPRPKAPAPPSWSPSTKSRQKMTVFLDGVQKYEWPVSTGRAGYSTPSGNYTATSMNEVWYSKEWDNAPCLILFSLERMAMPSMAVMR